MGAGLPTHLAESGIVTPKELKLAAAWLQAVTGQPSARGEWLDGWIGTREPFSFGYGGTESRYRVRLECSGRSMTLNGTALAEGIDVKIGKAPGAEMILYQPSDR